MYYKRPSGYTLNVQNIKYNIIVLCFTQFVFDISQCLNVCLCGETWTKIQNVAHPQKHPDKPRSQRGKKAGKLPDHWHRQAQPPQTVTEKGRSLPLSFPVMEFSRGLWTNCYHLFFQTAMKIVNRELTTSDLPSQKMWNI